MEELEDEYAIGLDFGTTFSCIGVYRNGTVEIIPNKNGDKTTPSVVIISNDNKILVGEETIDFLVKNYDSCIYEVKRLIGRQINEEQKIELQKRFPFQIITSNEYNFPEIQISKNGKNIIYSPLEISSFIIKKMVSNAERYLNKKITKLVITVPAYFNDSQRKLTKQAAEAAGLKVLRIINEPTAAALAYGFDKNQSQNVNKNILVFDLGGGTFDISILHFEKDIDNSINLEVLGTSGDINLGGEDFDNKLVEVVLNKTENLIDVNKVKENKEAIKRIKIACENAKKILSIKDSTFIYIKDIIKDFDLICRIFREEFETECGPLFDRLIVPIENALKMANLQQNDIKEVILVGGSTRIPKIQEIVSKYFKKSKINNSINPDEAVAYGATIEAEKILHNKDKIIENITLLDIIPFSLGTDIINKSNDPEIQKEGNIMDVIIKCGKHIPITNTRIYKTISDNQVSMSINIYEGNKKYVKYNNLLKKSNINNLKKRPKGKTLIEMKFDVDINGILNVEAREKTDDNSGQFVNLIIKNDELSLTVEEMEILKQKMKKVINGIGNSNEDKNINYLGVKSILKKYKDYYEQFKNKKMKIKKEESEEEDEDGIIYITNYYKTLEQLINKFNKNFDNETVFCKFYFYIKDLFQSYIEALTLNINTEDKIHIFKNIKEYIEIFIEKSSGYLNELLEILLRMNKKGRYKAKFYQLIIFIISKLNHLSKKYIINPNQYSKYYSSLFCEQAYKYIEKYFPKKLSKNFELKEIIDKNFEDERENLSFLPFDDLMLLKKECRYCLDYLKNIYSGTMIKCEEILLKGEIIGEKTLNPGLEKYYPGKVHTSIQSSQKNRYCFENLKEFLHNFDIILSVLLTTQENPKAEVLCIANIIKIWSYFDYFFKDNYSIALAERAQRIIEHLGLQKENWYNEYKEKYESLINSEYNYESSSYQELLEEIKKKYQYDFKNIDDNFNKMSTKDFIEYIVDNYPYKKNDKVIYNNDHLNPGIIFFLLKMYDPVNFKYMINNDKSKLRHCIAVEIFKKLKYIFTSISIKS